MRQYVKNIDIELKNVKTNAFVIIRNCASIWVMWMDENYFKPISILNEKHFVDIYNDSMQKFCLVVEILVQSSFNINWKGNVQLIETKMHDVWMWVWLMGINRSILEMESFYFSFVYSYAKENIKINVNYETHFMYYILYVMY